MVKFFQFLFLFLLTLFLVGCPREPLSPDQTVVGEDGDRPGFHRGGDPGAFGDEFSDDLAGEGLTMRGDDWGAEDGERGFFPSVYFDFDQSTIRRQDRAVLDNVARHLRDNPQDALLIEGHCDWRGTAEYNLALGDRRARSVVSYLEQLGIDRSRMETLSKGDLEATVTDDPNQLQEDRRAELILRRG